MDVIMALTTMLPFIVVVSAVLTASVSALLLWLYKRAVVRSMSASSGAPPPVSRIDLPGVSGKDSGLTITKVGAGDPVSGKGHTAWKATSASLRRIGVVYTVAGLAYACVLSLPWMVTAGGGFSLTRLLWLVVCYAWPTVVTLLLVVTTTRRQGYFLAGVYFGLVVAVSSIALIRNPEAGASDLIYLWIFAGDSMNQVIFYVC